jgi:heptosyltransferase III
LAINRLAIDVKNFSIELLAIRIKSHESNLMSSDPASVRHELVHFGVRKRLAGLLVGVGAVGLRFRTFGTPVPKDKRILIIEPFGLGDMVSLEPLVRAATQRGYTLGLCGQRQWKALYPDGPQLRWLDAALPWSAHDQRQKYVLKDYGSAELRNGLRDLREWGTGAIGLDTRGDIRSVAVLRLAGCARVLTLENYLGSNLITMPGSADRIPFDHSLRRWQLNLKFLQALNPALSIVGIQSPRFDHLLRPKRGDRKRIGLMPIAPWPGKWWSSSHWQSLVCETKAKNIEVVGLCGPGQAELAQKQLLRSVELQECNSIESWAEALTDCDLVVSLDSGPMHLADALGIPTVALFGQGQLPLWAPSNPRSVVISHQNHADFVPCQPVNENTGSGQKFMSRITVSEVVLAIESITAKW